MSELELDLAEIRYQLDPSPLNRKHLDLLAQSFNYIGIEMADQINRLSQTLLEYIREPFLTNWTGTPSNISLEDLAVQNLLRPILRQRQPSCSWRIPKDVLTPSIWVLLELVHHLQQHRARLSPSIRKDIISINETFAAILIRYPPPFRWTAQGEARSRYCNCNRSPFFLCESCGKPQCVCDQFETISFGRAFGGEVGAQTHPLPELCDCSGSGWITTYLDSSHKCPEHEGHHPECGEHFSQEAWGLPNPKKVNFTPCDCGYAKKQKLVSPCLGCGTLTNSYCETHNPAYCEQCTIYSVCPTCQKMICQLCAGVICVLCKKVGCKTDRYYFSCRICAKEWALDEFGPYCGECLKACPICEEYICRNCIEAHRSQPCQLNRALWSGGHRHAHWH